MANHSLVPCGTLIPVVASAQTMDSTATAVICMTVRAHESRPGDHSPRPTMCSPNSTAHTSVSSSPTLRAKPPSVISASPPPARRTASHTTGESLRRSSSQHSTGVKTTKRPVMNPDTAAGVCCRPIVWVM